MKKLLIAGSVVAVLLGAAHHIANSNPAIGQAALAYGGELEAKLRGFSEKTVTAAGIDHRLYEGGTPGKPVLVLLHGYSADKDVWPRFASFLAKDFHIIIPDMAGHGETGFKPEWTYDVPSQADRIVALMDAMQVGQFHVAGNSMGGMITATLALKYPQRVLTASALDPAGVLPPQPSAMDVMVANGRNPFEVANHEEFREFYGMTMAKPPFLPDFVLRGLGQTYRDRKAELATIFKSLYRQDGLDERLSDIKPPMLLMWGDQDQLLHVSSVDVWKAGVPDIEVVVLPGIGHMPMVEDPEQSAKLVGDFIRRKSN